MTDGLYYINSTVRMTPHIDFSSKPVLNMISSYLHIFHTKLSGNFITTKQYSFQNFHTFSFDLQF